MNIYNQELATNIKTSFFKGIKQEKQLHDYGLANIATGFATHDILANYPQFKEMNL